MSTLFKACVENTEGVECRITLYIIHPDQIRFYDTKSFTLQLIWDATRAPKAVGGQSSPLALEIGVDQIGDPKYVLKHQDSFIESVSYLEFKNYPRSVSFDDMTDEEFDEYWKNEKGLSQAVLLIKVTDSRWISHLSNGLTWETSAFDYEM